MKISFSKKDPLLVELLNLGEGISDEELFIRLSFLYSKSPFSPMINILNDQIYIEIPSIIPLEEWDSQAKTSYQIAYKTIAALAEHGQFQEAKKRLISLKEENRTNSDLHRIHGQIYFEEKELNLAEEHFIEGLKYNPQHSGIWMMLGNLYQEKGDQNFAKKLYKRAIDLDKSNVFAISNYGGLCIKENTSQSIAEGEKYLLQAFAIDPHYMINNLNLVGHFYNTNEYWKAFEYGIEVLENTKDQPIPTVLVDMLLDISSKLYTQFNAIKYSKKIIEEIEQLGGKKVIIRESNGSEEGAILETAEFHGRDRHIIWYNPNKNYKIGLIQKLEQLKWIVLSRRREGVQVITQTQKNLEIFISDILGNNSNFVRKFSGNKNELNDFLREQGNLLGSMIANFPMEILFNYYIYKDHPELKPMLFLNLYNLTNIFATMENKIMSDPTIEGKLPFVVGISNIAMNMVSTILLKERFGLNKLHLYQNENLKELSLKLYKSFSRLKDEMKPGDEYLLIKSWGELLDISSYFSFRTANQYIESKQKLDSNMMHFLGKEEGNDHFLEREEHTNLEKFKEKYIILLNIEKMTNPHINEINISIVMHCLAALHFFKNKNLKQIAFITEKMAERGASGISYKDTESIYGIDIFPHKKFTGLQFLSYMFVGYQLSIPNKDPQLNFYHEYEFAKKIFEKEK